MNDYLRDNYWARLQISGKDVRKLNIAACRLMLDILPGLETSAVFEKMCIRDRFRLIITTTYTVVVRITATTTKTNLSRLHYQPIRYVKDASLFRLIITTTVSYTHLDVYKRQTLHMCV